MKKTILFILSRRTTIAGLCLAFFSLACLQSAAISDQSAISSPTSESLRPSAVHVAEPTLTKVPTAASGLSQTSNVDQCAVVIAIEALHLRQDASERSQSLAFMTSGEVVRLLARSDPDWWFIESSAGVHGYARSKYLKVKEC